MTHEIDRIAEPLLYPPQGAPLTSARQLTLSACSVEHARLLNARWHSRLPRTQRSPWQFAFRLVHDSITYGVALLHNPSARCLPHHWIELRRLAIAPDAPRYAATRFLSLIVKYLIRHHADREMIVSYQDTSVHEGTIYRAAGWQIGAVQQPRARNRHTLRPSGRAYRTSDNGPDPDQAGKVRWERPLRKLSGGGAR